MARNHAEASYTEANRKVWNEAAPVHATHLPEIQARFAEHRYSCVDDVLTNLLKSIGVEGSNVAQLCCNNGQELLSIRNLGAGRCTGFDISDGFIQQARLLASSSEIEAEFVRINIYDVPEDFNGQFDLALVTVGALGWMPDLSGFFAVAARLLKPGGRVLIYEMHPMLDLFEPGDSSNPPSIQYSYFRTAPYIETGGLDYLGNTTYESPPAYWFHHRIADIFQCCLVNGLAITHFEEYAHDLSSVFKSFEQHTHQLPLSFSLIAGR